MFVYLRLPLSVSQEPLSGDNYCFTAIFGAATFINAEHFCDQEENTDIHVFMGIFSKQTIKGDALIKSFENNEGTMYIQLTAVIIPPVSIIILPL